MKPIWHKLIFMGVTAELRGFKKHTLINGFSTISYIRDLKHLILPYLSSHTVEYIFIFTIQAVLISFSECL